MLKKKRYFQDQNQQFNSALKCSLNTILNKFTGRWPQKYNYLCGTQIKKIIKNFPGQTGKIESILYAPKILCLDELKKLNILKENTENNKLKSEKLMTSVK